jgi:hypothetical protein
MSSEANLTSSTGDNRKERLNPDDLMSTDDESRSQSGVFVAPSTPNPRSLSLVDLSKKADGGEKKGGRGRPRKRSARENLETDDENGKWLEEIELTIAELKSKIGTLENKVSEGEKVNRELKEKVVKLENDNDMLRKWKDGIEKRTQDQPLKANQIPTFSSILRNKENEQLIKKMARSEVKAVDNIEKNI